LLPKSAQRHLPPISAHHTSSLSISTPPVPATTLIPFSNFSFFAVDRPSGFEPVSQARSSRAKTKPGKDAGSVNGSAIRATEDAARRRFAAASAVSGSPDRTRSVAQTHFPPAITGSGSDLFHPYNCQRSSRPAEGSEFILNMKGGEKSLLVNSTSLCGKARRATAEFTGQNGKVLILHPALQSSCKGRSHHNGRVSK
jgi:hypothetical protein